MNHMSERITKYLMLSHVENVRIKQKRNVEKYEQGRH